MKYCTHTHNQYAEAPLHPVALLLPVNALRAEHLPVITAAHPPVNGPRSPPGKPMMAPLAAGLAAPDGTNSGLITIQSPMTVSVTTTVPVTADELVIGIRRNPVHRGNGFRCLEWNGDDLVCEGTLYTQEKPIMKRRGHPLRRAPPSAGDSIPYSAAPVRLSWMAARQSTSRRRATRPSRRIS